MDNQVVPIWLPWFIEPANAEHKDHYFAVCKEHGVTYHKDMRKVQKNYYCVDCKTRPLCEKGFKTDHGGHTVLQVRKDCGHDLVHIDDISTLFNIDHIQIFRINGNKVVFLPSRPQSKPTKGSPSHCDVCERSQATKSVSFCSLSCKVKAIEGHPRGDFPPASSKKKDTVPKKKKRARKDEGNDALILAHSEDEVLDEVKDTASLLVLVKSGYELSPPVRGPPAVPKKKRSTSSSKKRSPLPLQQCPHIDPWKCCT